MTWQPDDLPERSRGDSAWADLARSAHYWRDVAVELEREAAELAAAPPPWRARPFATGVVFGLALAAAGWTCVQGATGGLPSAHQVEPGERSGRQTDR